MVGGAESQSFLPMRKDRKTFKKYFELLLHNTTGDDGIEFTVGLVLK